MIAGYAGKMLFVDLSKGKIWEEELPEDLAKNFVGGYGLGARVLYDRMKPGVDPLGPDNMLGFTTGPLTGTGAFFSGRFTVVCKSPVTGGWNDANGGGYWGPELKKAGYDAIFFTGKAEHPVYLWVEDGKAELRDASHLWGKDVEETEKMLIEETGNKKTRSAVIGPAGEKLSLIAAVMTDGHRAAARGGPGAVMGSKNLKAVAVHGTLPVPVANPEKLREVQKAISSAVNVAENQLAAVFKDHGTASLSAPSALDGDSPVKNWGGVGVVDFGDEAAKKMDGFALDALYKTQKYSCSNCALGCGAVYKSEGGKWPLEKTDRPEYETSAAFGVLMLNSDSEALLKCNDICNRYGLDVISTGATIAWAIECFENGLLTLKDTDGIELRWGNAPAIVAMTQALAEQKGFGKILAQGSQAAAKQLGKGFEYLVTVKGIELPMHDPRLAPGLARTYQTDPTPARHVKGGLWFIQMFQPEGKYNYENTGQMDLFATSGSEIVNTAGLCVFQMYSGIQDAPAQLLEAVTGWSFPQEKQVATGMRIMDMRQAFNLREGLKPSDFVLPTRAVGGATQGPVAGVQVDSQRLAQNYFEAMSWDMKSGKPSQESLKALGGMEDVIQDLYGA